MAHRVPTGTPVNLKERIALLQQRAASASPHTPSSPSSPFTHGSVSASTSASSSTTSSPAPASASALRERIAKFEQKGGVPVPRGSFGLGAPPPQLAQTHEGSAARRRGELYGNRIASVSRATPAPASPSSALRMQLTGNGDIHAARSLAPGAGVTEPGDGSPVRKRCVSTSGLEGLRPVSVAVFPTSITSPSGSFDEGESADSDVHHDTPTMQLSAPDEAQAPAHRRSSVSNADATNSSVSDSSRLSVVEERPLCPSDAGVSEDEEVPELLPSSIDDHVTEENHEGSVAVERVEIEDESLIKTPVVLAFSQSSIDVPPATEDASSSDGQEITVDVPSDEHALSDVSTPITGSPFSASLEVGERAFSEAHTYVVIPPAEIRDTTIANVLEQHNTLQDEDTGSSETQEGVGSEGEVALALGISGTSENLVSTETVNVPNSVSLPAQVAEESALSPQSTGSSSIYRRSPPAPLPVQHDKEYSEPSLDPKTVPKSFHAVVHRKQTPAATASSTATLPRTATPRVQVVVVHSHSDSDAPGSPDLSALVAQAMHLEQRLMDGDTDVHTPRADAEAFDSQSASKSDTSASTSRVSHVTFPRSIIAHEALDEAPDTAPAPPPKSPNPRTSSQVGAGSRKSWGWSSENASSEDSVPVLTPPSPTFDLVTPPLFDEHAFGLGAGEAGEHSDNESRRSVSSMLSSSGRSARKKVLSMSRGNNVLGRMLLRAGRSSSTLALPDDIAPDSTYTCDPTSASVSASVSIASTRSPSPVRGTISQLPGLSLPLSKHNTPDVPRPVSILSTATISGFSVSTASPLDVDFFDSFPDVPHSMPPNFEQVWERGRDYKQEIQLENEKEVIIEEIPQSPPPPTPPSKSPILRGYVVPSPPRIQLNIQSPPPPPKSQSPPPPSPPSKNDSPSSSSFSLSGKNPRKSKSKSSLRLPHLPYRSSHHAREPSDASTSASHAPSSYSHSSSSSFFASITRSLSGRVRSRVNSSGSRVSVSGEYGSSS